MKIDGKEYYVRYTVQVQKGQNGIHSQFVSNIDLYNAKNPNSGLSYRDSSLAARGTADGIVDSKLRNFFILANGDAKSFAQRLKYATGWELGADGKWRYEVHGYGIEEAVDNWRMGILKHHLTDKAYDELQSITDSKGRHDAIKEHALNALAFPVL